LFALLGAVSCVQGQTVSVVPVPYPQFVSYLQNGTPNAFGCVFTYSVNTTAPLPTYTDGYSGTLNQNPVGLSAGGTASIWLQTGTLYTLVVKSSGGTNCSSGSTLYTVNGIGNGGTTQTIAVPYSATPTFTATSQNTLFTIILTGNAVMLPLVTSGLQSPAYITFQLTQDATGGRTFTWPSNIIGGCTIGSLPNQVTTQEFIWNGTNATAAGPCVTGNGPSISVGSLSFGGIPFTPPIKNTTVVTQTGDTSLHTIYTIPIPALAMSATGQMRITLVMATNVTAGHPSIEINYGGTLITPNNTIAAALAGGNGVYAVVVGGNLGVTNSQSWDTLVAQYFSFTGPGNGNHATSTVDSTVSQNLTVTYQGGANSDSITFYRIIVEFL